MFKNFQKLLLKICVNYLVVESLFLPIFFSNFFFFIIKFVVLIFFLSFESVDGYCIFRSMISDRRYHTEFSPIIMHDDHVNSNLNLLVNFIDLNNKKWKMEHRASSHLVSSSLCFQPSY